MTHGPANRDRSEARSSECQLLSLSSSPSPSSSSVADAQERICGLVLPFLPIWRTTAASRFVCAPQLPPGFASPDLSPFSPNPWPETRLWSGYFLKDEVVPAFHAAFNLELNLQRRSRDGLSNATFSQSLNSQQLHFNVTKILGTSR